MESRLVPSVPFPCQPTHRPYFTYEKCLVEGCYGCSVCNGRAAHRKFRVGTSIEGHVDCPDDCDLCGPRRYQPDDRTSDQIQKVLSDDHYNDLREWLIANKFYERPEYPDARRYGVAGALWFPGSEDWSEEELDEYINWRRNAWFNHARPPAFLMERRE